MQVGRIRNRASVRGHQKLATATGHLLFKHYFHPAAAEIFALNLRKALNYLQLRRRVHVKHHVNNYVVYYDRKYSLASQNILINQKIKCLSVVNNRFKRRLPLERNSIKDTHNCCDTRCLNCTIIRQWTNCSQRKKERTLPKQFLILRYFLNFPVSFIILNYFLLFQSVPLKEIWSFFPDTRNFLVKIVQAGTNQWIVEGKLQT